MLGCLVEKQLTTPQQYPLTLNALVSATNQATNRDPVVDLTEETLLGAVDELRAEHLVRVVLPSHGRSVKRYRHVLDEVYGLDATRCGLLAVLLLRGPQTVGELRARTERMIDLPSTGDVQAELDVLADHPEGLVRLLARRPGQKEDRWQQILATPWSPVGGSGNGGAIMSSQVEERVHAEAGHGPSAATDDRGEDGPAADTPSHQWDDLVELREEMAALRESVATLRSDLDDLRRGLGD